MKKTSIVIAAHNMLAYTRQCIEAIRIFVPADFREIIVVDNASKDGTAQWLEQQSDIRVIRNADNRGLAAAWNQGIQASTEDNLLFLHNDVLLLPDVLEKLQQLLYQQDQIGAVAPVSNRSQFIFQYAPPVPYDDFDGLVRAAQSVAQQAEPVQPAIFLEDFCLLVKKTAIQAIGAFDERYQFHGLEDMDFSFQMEKAGYSLRIASQVYVHHENGTLRQAPKAAAKIYRVNQQYFQEKWGFHPTYSTNVRTELLAYMDLQQKNLQVLDVGCACGGNLMQIQFQNPQADLYGIECNAHSAAIAQSFGKIYDEDVEEMAKAEWQEKFDYILMGDVLEHLRDPWKTVQNMQRYLKSGGKLIANIPNVAHISILNQMLHGRWHYTDAGILDRTHLRFFTKPEIMDMMCAAALEVERMEYSQIRLTDEEMALKRQLSALPGHQVNGENMLAYQWYVVARNK